MKLLFDENLSPNLPGLVLAVFPGSEHVRETGLKGRTDEEIWDYARANGFTIISKDKDFYQRALFYGSPPKLIWLRLGNCTRDELLDLIQRHETDILAFESSTEFVLVLS
jgi:predicted nuclease of predicted toxin-antitoxin system